MFLLLGRSRDNLTLGVVIPVYLNFGITQFICIRGNEFFSGDGKYEHESDGNNFLQKASLIIVAGNELLFLFAFSLVLVFIILPYIAVIRVYVLLFPTETLLFFENRDYVMCIFLSPTHLAEFLYTV